jgi:hypothetical protein
MREQNFLRRRIRPAAILAGIMQPRPKTLAKGTHWVDPRRSIDADLHEHHHCGA